MARARALPGAAPRRATRRRWRARSSVSAHARRATSPSRPRRPWPGRAARSCASTASTTRRAPASSAAPSSRPAIGSPVLTIHLFAPQVAGRVPRAAPTASTRREVERFLRFYAEACLARGVTPLIENVPPVLRMRTGGVYLSPVGGPLARPARLARARARARASRSTPRTRRCSASSPPPTRRCSGSPPTTSSSSSATSRSSGRAAEVAHVSDAHGLLGEGLPYGSGELDLDPVVARLGRAGAVHRGRDQRAGPRALAAT